MLRFSEDGWPFSGKEGAKFGLRYKHTNNQRQQASGSLKELDFSKRLLGFDTTHSKLEFMRMGPRNPGFIDTATHLCDSDPLPQTQ